MARMTAMQAAIRVLESEGVEVVFGIPGAAILPFYEALKASRIKHYVVRHEEGGAHAARATAAPGPAGSGSTSGPRGRPAPT